MKNYYSTQGLCQQTIPQKPQPNIRSDVSDQFLKDDESLPDIPTPIDEDDDETLFNTSTQELNTVLPPQTCVKSKSDSLIQPESMTIVGNDRDIGEFIIHELIDNLSDLCNVEHRFGYHMAAILRYSKMQQIMFPDHTKLRLTCLGEFDIFSNTERDEVIDKVTTKQGSQPVLLWLYQTVLPIFFGQWAYRGTLHLTPQIPSHHQATTLPCMDIKIRAITSGIRLKLQIHRGGQYLKREIFEGTACRIRSAPSNKVENNVITTSHTGDSNMRPAQGLVEVIDYLWSGNSKWHMATMALLEQNSKTKDEFYARLIRAKEPYEKYLAVSDLQSKECLALFRRFPPYAIKQLKDQLGEISPFGNKSII